MIPPARPFAPRLRSDAMMELVPVPTQPLVPAARIPGDIVLPGSPAVEQELAWVFPQLAAAPITPQAVQTCLLQCWDWAVGAVAHRVIIGSMTLNLATAQQEAQTVSTTLRKIIDRFDTDELPDAALLAAHLDQPVDVFGPPTAAQLTSIRWGRRQEFRLASEQGPEAWAADTQSRARYSSLESIISLDAALLSQRASTQISYYAQNSYDIAAFWRDKPSLAQLGREAQRQARMDSFVEWNQRRRQIKDQKRRDREDRIFRLEQIDSMRAERQYNKAKTAWHRAHGAGRFWP